MAELQKLCPKEEKKNVLEEVLKILFIENHHLSVKQMVINLE